MSISSLPKEYTQIILGDLDLCTLEHGISSINDEPVLYDKDYGTGIIIDRYTYQVIADYLIKTHAIKKKIERAGNEFTKQFLIQEERDLIIANNKTKFDSILYPLVSAMVNSEGFKYNHEQVWDMKINAFMDSVERIKRIKNVNYMMQGYYNGTIDLSKGNQKELNWLGEL